MPPEVFHPGIGSTSQETLARGAAVLDSHLPLPLQRDPPVSGREHMGIFGRRTGWQLGGCRPPGGPDGGREQGAALGLLAQLPTFLTFHCGCWGGARGLLRPTCALTGDPPRLCVTP
ncbi:hypothetical protein H1C71_032658 [Ictidomys tridecemlineatus]|nr:hypothetical protein H1C71_032658 [Ictidomys tridecemlineatus]